MNYDPLNVPLDAIENGYGLPSALVKRLRKAGLNTLRQIADWLDAPDGPRGVAISDPQQYSNLRDAISCYENGREP